METPTLSNGYGVAKKASTQTPASSSACRVLKSGWLEKRYPLVGGKWAWRWCVLAPATLTYYEDMACHSKKGTIKLRPVTRLTRFQSSDAPEDAAVYGAERQCGFALEDICPFEARHLFLFDAKEEVGLESWMQVVGGAIAELQQKASNLIYRKPTDSCTSPYFRRVSICHLESPANMFARIHRDMMRVVKCDIPLTLDQASSSSTTSFKRTPSRLFSARPRAAAEDAAGTPAEVFAMLRVEALHHLLRGVLPESSEEHSEHVSSAEEVEQLFHHTLELGDLPNHIQQVFSEDYRSRGVASPVETLARLTREALSSLETPAMVLGRVHAVDMARVCPSRTSWILSWQHGSMEAVQVVGTDFEYCTSRALAAALIRSALKVAFGREEAAARAHERTGCAKVLVTLESVEAAIKKSENSDKSRCVSWPELWRRTLSLLTSQSDAEIPSSDAAAILAFSLWRRTQDMMASWLFWTRTAASHLTLAIRAGIPQEWRGAMWYMCSDAATKRQAQIESYAKLVVAGHNLPESECVRIIEADLPRTGMKGTNQQVLRNVLLAFAASNANIGYCQSMNFIAATLLLYIDEERGFWMLRSLIEDILPPDYFTSGMAGLRIDLKVLGSLTELYLPKLFRHLENEQLDLSAITMNWFLCLFLNTLPTDLSHRVLDCLMHEGTDVLFRVSLAILQAKEEALLGIVSLPDAYTVLRAPCESDAADDIFGRMYGPWLDNWPADQLSRLRKIHLSTVQAEDVAAAERKAARVRVRAVAEAARASGSETPSATSEPEVFMEPATMLKRVSEELQELDPLSPMSGLWTSLMATTSWLSPDISQEAAGDVSQEVVDDVSREAAAQVETRQH